MKPALLALLLTLMQLSTAAEISSEFASMQDGLIKLDGNVQCHNAMGILCADHATVKTLNQKSLEEIILNQQVLINLTQKGTLSAHKGSLDFIKQTGSFESGIRPVQYIDYFTNADSGPFKIECKTMNWRWRQVDNKPILSKLAAKDAVKFTLGTTFCIEADEADFTPSITKNETFLSGGILQFISKLKPCFIEYKQDQMHAKCVSYDSSSEVITCEDIEGILHINETKSPHEVFFKAHSGSFETKNLQLLLKGGGEIRDNLFGKINFDDKLSIKQRARLHSKELDSFSSQGLTKFVFQQNNQIIRLTSPLRTRVDHGMRKILIETGDDTSKQITYEDDSTMIAAQYGQIDYILSKNSPVTQRAQFHQNVVIYPKRRASFTKATADHLEYIPSEQKFVLRSKTSPVQIIDHQTNMEVLTDSLTIDLSTQPISFHTDGKIYAKAVLEKPLQKNKGIQWKKP